MNNSFAGIQKEVLKSEEELTKIVNDILSFSDLIQILKSDFANQKNDLASLFKEKQVTHEEYVQELKKLQSVYKIHISDIKQSVGATQKYAFDKYEKNIKYKKEHKQEIKNILKSLSDEIDELKKVDKKNSSISTLKEKKKSLVKPISTNFLKVFSIIAVPLILVCTLLVNYFVYFPNTRNGELDLSKSEYLIAFIIVILTLVITGIYFYFLVFKVLKKSYIDRENNIFKLTSIGVCGSFLDTIGVGSFAVATAGLKATKTMKNDALLPGTLNVGLGIPNLIAGTVFVAAIDVGTITLVSLVLAAIIGSFLGAELTKRISAKYISVTMGALLAIVGILMFLIQLDILPSGNATSLEGWKLGLGIGLFFVYGGLQAFGIGLYAPALATITLLGMDIKVAFPIMTLASGSAFPLAAYSYYKNNNYLPKTSFGLMVGGTLGVALAFLVVFVGIEVGAEVKTAVFTNYLKWLAILVVYYVAFVLIMSYVKARKKSANSTKITEHQIIYAINNRSTWDVDINLHLSILLKNFNENKQAYEKS